MKMIKTETQTKEIEYIFLSQSRKTQNQCLHSKGKFRGQSRYTHLHTVRCITI